MEITKDIAAVVTGGASGLGRATATAMRAAGIKVAIFDLNEELGQQVAEEIGATFCKVNIGDEASVIDGFAIARAANGQERVTVHCAMGSRSGKTISKNRETGALRRLSTEDYQFGADLTLVASYRIASLSALGMAAADALNEDGERGVIVLTASVAAMDAQIGQVVYGSTKAGVNGLVLPLARDLMDFGIRVNSIMPGVFSTPLMLAVKDKAPQVFENLAASVPFPKRLGNPPEFASLVLEMVRNTYLNGQNIRLDGAIRMPPK